MLLHKTYKTEEEKLEIIQTMKGKGLNQESTKGIFIGSGHLLFTDGKPEPKTPRDLAAEVDDLKARIEKLEAR